MSFFKETEAHFNSMTDEFFTDLKADEAASFNFLSEEQNYLRFNSSKIRQSTFVHQHDVQIEFQKGQRKTNLALQLSGHAENDLMALKDCLQRAREEVLILPEDPFLVPIKNHGETHRHYPGISPQPKDVADFIAEQTQGTEFSGLFASGPLIRANINSQGQNHWFSSENFFLDYSLYTVNTEGENKAVKGAYSSNEWKNADFLEDLTESKLQLKKLREPSKQLLPGTYRAYLAPGAMDDLVQMMGWGALSYAAYKRGQCALAKLYEGTESFSPMITMAENFDLGLGPQFTGTGEVTPTHLPLIESGKLKNLLVSERTAKEFGISGNGTTHEMPRSLDLKGGQLARRDTLKKLDTGVYLSNLHYCNWSDLQHARITGMTRYACFWVERGEIVAPIKDMRFDDSLFTIWGAQLEDLTTETRVISAIDTYANRQLGGKKIPGLLTKELRFTL